MRDAGTDRDNNRSKGRRPFDDKGLPIGLELAAALAFFQHILPLLKPRVFDLYRKRRKPIIVYTDAMYQPGAEVPARIGVAFFDPEDTAFKWRHTSAVVPAWLMVKFAARKQYIGVLVWWWEGEEVNVGIASYSRAANKVLVVVVVDDSGFEGRGDRP